MATKSKFEDKVLLDLKTRGLNAKYESLKLKYDLIGLGYTPDLVLPNGIVVELKGYFRTESRTKMIAVRATNPVLDIRFVFQKLSSKVQGSKKMTCEDWAIKYGFQYAEGTVPDAWFKE